MASYKNFSQKKRAEQDWSIYNNDSVLSYELIN